MTRNRRSRPVLIVFGGIVGLQLLVAILSIDLLSAVRAYGTGESLYSKGQKDAQIHLIEYAEFHREEDYQRFLTAIAAPIGDRLAREAMQRRMVDTERARKGLLQSGTHADDIPGVIRLFSWFHDTPLMADAIATWTEGDLLIEEMRRLAEQAHQRIRAGDVRALEVTQLRQAAQELNKRLTPLELRFATQLGDGARLSQRLLLGLNLGLAGLLGLSGLAFVRHSARVQAATDEEVRRRGASLQRLLDSAAEGLYGVDTQGRCTFINRSALRMLGYADEADLLGRELHASIHQSQAEGNGRPAGESRIARSYREQRELHISDEVLWRRDGTSFPVEYWSHPMFEDGQLHGAVATFFDITERTHLQAALRQGEVRIAGLVDAVNDGVLTIDDNERIVVFNRAAERLFGVAAAQAIGSTVERFIPRRPHRGEGSRAQELRLEGADNKVRELFGKRNDGHEFPLEASLSSLETERGRLVTAVLRDVTGLQTARAERQAHAALEASNRAKTEFLSRMSHELRTPLNAVLGFAQLLRLDAARPPSLQQLEHIQHIENAGAHLLALVNDVLDLSRVESGQMTVKLEAVDLRSAVEDAISMVLPLAATGGVRTVIEGLQGPAVAWPISVTADRLRLRQVLVNLLSNAVKYNRSGGEVRVSWQVAGDGCELHIADDGVGMAPDKLARLFEPFNRLGAEHSKIEGTGIGLVLSRRLVELMRGRLRIESTLARGTRASLSLACSATAALPLGSHSPPSQHGQLDETLRVLYAEDNEVNVEIVRELVKLRPSVIFDVAETGADAFNKARHDPPQLMLVDMNLGDMTGIELAKALRADPSTAGIRLVALSADALPEQIEAALAIGFEDYITKPIDFRELLNVLDGRPSR
ncbi:MAG: PAS domain S-box protein [Pseudomonadota bacterium]|nr:PAS domain S-box protein [Pseudomonadota bacterium]